MPLCLQHPRASTYSTPAYDRGGPRAERRIAHLFKITFYEKGHSHAKTKRKNCLFWAASTLISTIITAMLVHLAMAAHFPGVSKLFVASVAGPG